MSLEALTPRGLEASLEAEQAIALWETANPGWSFWWTPNDLPAAVDGIILRNGKVAGVAEVKCRDLDEQTFRRQFNSEWLVTHSKLERARLVADGLAVPLVGFLYLAQDQVLLTQRLAIGGEFVARLRIERTTTAATCNGGTAVRSNAFIDMTDAKRYAKFSDRVLACAQEIG